MGDRKAIFIYTISKSTLSSSKKFVFCFLLTGLMTLHMKSSAQAIPDSLLKRLGNASNDSVRIRAMLDLGEFSEATSLVSSRMYYFRALNAAEKIHNKALIFSALNDVGISYIEGNKLDSAIIYLEKAVIVGRALGNLMRVARVTANIGNVYLAQNNRLLALDYYLNAANEWEKASDQTGLPSLYSNISMLLTDQTEYNKALEYGRKGYALATKIGDGHSAVNSLLNLSVSYSSLNQFDNQVGALNQALPLAVEGEDIEQISAVYHGLGDYYYKLGQNQQALKNFLLSYSYVKQMDNHFHLCANYTALANVYFKLRNQAMAMKYVKLAEATAIEVGSRANLKEIYQIRADIEQAGGNYKTAADFYSKRIELSDSLFKSETSGKVADVEAKYQNEKKQLQILQLEKDKRIQTLAISRKSLINYSLGGLAAILMILVFIINRNLRNRQVVALQRHEIQEQRIRVLEKDKQLVAVDSLLQGQEDERSRLAKDLHDGLGGLLSGVKFSLSNMKDNLIITPDNMAVFERSLDMIDTSISELRRVAHNMMPEMLGKFGLDEALKEYFQTINATGLLFIKYQSLGMEVRINSSTEIILYRILQELLNNTMKHAVATEVFVQVLKEERRLNIIYEDNGKGFDQKAASINKGAGLINIKSRVEYLNGQLDIHSEPGKGTLVNIELNLKS